MFLGSAQLVDVHGVGFLSYQHLVNPIYPGLFWYIRYRGGHIVPPLSILGLGGVRVPILFGNDLPMNDRPFPKGFRKFKCLEPSKIMFDFQIFLLRLAQFERVP